MKKLLVVAIVFIVVGVFLWPEPPARIVERTPAPESLRPTTAGPVVGFHDDDDTLAWLGIPFANVPVGELRWAAPRLPEPWPEPR